VLWAGQPDRGLVFFRALPITIGGGLMLSILFVIFLFVFLAQKQKDFMFLIPLGFISLFLLGLVLYPFFSRGAAAKTCYLLTNRRAIVWKPGFLGFGGVSPTNYSPAELTNLRRRDSWFFGDGAGDVIFKSVTVITTTYSNRGSRTSSRTTLYGFLSIRKAKDVEALIRETLVDPLLDRINDEDDD
jgi:hypothetical protein